MAKRGHGPTKDSLNISFGSERRGFRTTVGAWFDSFIWKEEIKQWAIKVWAAGDVLAASAVPTSTANRCQPPWITSRSFY